MDSNEMDAKRQKKNRRNDVRRFFFHGGAGEDRTLDLLHAKQALSQLSYGPMTKAIIARAFGSVKRKKREERVGAFRHFIEIKRPDIRCQMSGSAFWSGARLLPVFNYRLLDESRSASRVFHKRISPKAMPLTTND